MVLSNMYCTIYRINYEYISVFTRLKYIRWNVYQFDMSILVHNPIDLNDIERLSEQILILICSINSN